MSTNTFSPDYAIHPGEYLEEVLEARAIKQRDLADRMGVQETYLSHLIKGKKPVGPDVALKLERVLGIRSSLWNNLNANFRLFEAQSKEKEVLSKKVDWVREFPLAWMKKLGFIPNIRSAQELIEPVLDFFGVSSPEVWEDYYPKQAISYRKSDTFISKLKSSAAWLRAGEIRAGGIETQPYNEKLFKKNLTIIRSLTTQSPDIFEPEMVRLCGEAGVALSFVPEPPGLHVFGATKWLNPNKALIVLSLRKKSDDQFWFSFFHEAGHILLHGKKDTFIDDNELPKSKQEDEANNFSREMLIPQAQYSSFTRRGSFYKQDIIRFASSQGIAPGIVVGFLQHDKLLDFKFHNGLKKHFKFIEE
jgi:addiction module HigA family antidote